jgi:predicted protein tyrosine phosphatase
MQKSPPPAPLALSKRSKHTKKFSASFDQTQQQRQSLVSAFFLGAIMADHGPLSKEEAHWLSKCENASVRAQAIEPRLFLGPHSAARNVGELRARGITHVVNLSQLPLHVAKALGLQVLDVDGVDDTPTADLLTHLPAIHKFIDDALKASPQHVVLVVCIMGRSRSACAVVWHLMQRDGIDMTPALARVRAQRLSASPNLGFRFQLQHRRLPTADEAAELTRQDEIDVDENDEA